MASDQVYNESEIAEKFGEDYDQPKPPDDAYDTPYRSLTLWYLTTTTKPESRAALPETKFKKNQVLCGMLQGKSTDMAPVKVEIPVANLVVSVDFSEEKRGLWVATTEAWYWLHDCHESQEELHQPMRAKFGLLSNLIDTLLEDDKYFETYEKLAPKLVHQKLSCLDEALFQVYKQNQANDILYFQEPFDYTLLSEQGGVTLLKQHLGGLFPGLEKSKFWKELVKLKGRKPGTAKWTPEQYRASAELAEERSQRTAWGMKLPNAKPIRPNWNMEARLDQERYQESPKAQRQRVSKDSDDEEPAKKKSKKTNKQKKNPLENDEYRRRQEVALAALEMKKEAYSDERMVESLDELKEFLTPEPTNESGTWDGVVAKKFMVKDAESAKAIVMKMRDSGSDLSNECKLLIITAFLNVCTKEDKGKEEKRTVAWLCKAKEGVNSGLGILEEWKREALETLNRLGTLATDDDSWFKGIVARRLLINYILFVKKCYVIDDATKLKTLKKKYNIDWNQPDYLYDVMDFERTYAHGSNELISRCMLIRKHLQDLVNKKRTAEALDPPAAREVAPTVAPASGAGGTAVAMDTDTQEASAQAPEAALATKTTVAVDTAMKEATKARDDKEEKKKKAADERRKKVLARAQGQHSSQSTAKPASQPASQPISQSISKPAPSKPAPASTRPYLDLSNRPREPIVPTWAPIAGNEFFLKKNLAKTAALLEDVNGVSCPQEQRGRAQETASRTSQPTARRDVNRESSSRRRSPTNERSARADSGDRGRDERRDRSLERATRDRPPLHDRGPRDRPPMNDRRENERPPGSYSQLGESPSGRRNSHDRGGRRSRSPDRRYEERPMDHRRSRSPDRHYEGRPMDHRRSRSPDRMPVDFRRDRGFDDRPPDDRSMGYSLGRGTDQQQATSRPNDTGRSFVLSADYEREPQRNSSHLAPSNRNGPVDNRYDPRFEDRDRDRQPAFQGAAQRQEAPVDGTASLGRGRGRPVPSWMENSLSNGPAGAAAQPPAAMQSSAPVPALDLGTTSLGRGRGRTIPAWMEKEQANNGPPGVAAAQPQISALPPLPSSVAQPPPVPSQDTSSRGRGRGRTIPAWMERAQANGPSGAAPVVLAQPPAAPAQSVMAVAEAAAAALEGLTSLQPSVAVQPPPTPFEGMSSQGRGRGRTFPAWMERAQANGTAPAAVAVSQQPAAGGGGRGMGRGLHATKPAWQTHGSM